MAIAAPGLGCVLLGLGFLALLFDGIRSWVGSVGSSK